MQLSDDGFQRPVVRDGEVNQAEVNLFKRICPGISVVAPQRSSGDNEHPIFGRYRSAWIAYASNPSVRDAGSSGGVLTSLLADGLETGKYESAVAVTSDERKPVTSVALTIVSKEEALASAGSRYAPVATLSALKQLPGPQSVFVGKPCEASALDALLAAESRKTEDRPLVLSFFCAGTPSQNATDRLVSLLGGRASDVKKLKYRGGGWPGEFQVESADGHVAAMSYNESWGTHLGRDVQWRCKLCVDGTGAHADISVGDYWKTDAQGYPIFEDADGLSIAIARTKRGHDILMQARDSGTLVLSTADLDIAASVQPLQTDRKLTLAARLVGRFAAGHSVTRYSGYHLIRRQIGSLAGAPRAAARTFVRSRQH